MRRRVHEAIELDQSLRRSRSVWLVIAVIFLLPAIFGVINVLMLLGFSTASAGVTLIDALWDAFWGAVLVAIDILSFGRVAEANRRLRLLREDPEATVRPMPIPFWASLHDPFK